MSSKEEISQMDESDNVFLNIATQRTIDKINRLTNATS